MFISIVSSPLLGILSDRLGMVKPLMGGTLLVLAVCTALYFLFSGWPLLLVSVLSGIFGNSCAALLMVAYLKVLPRP